MALPPTDGICAHAWRGVGDKRIGSPRPVWRPGLALSGASGTQSRSCDLLDGAAGSPQGLACRSRDRQTRRSSRARGGSRPRRGSPRSVSLPKRCPGTADLAFLCSFVGLLDESNRERAASDRGAEGDRPTSARTCRSRRPARRPARRHPARRHRRCRCTPRRPAAAARLHRCGISKRSNARSATPARPRWQLDARLGAWARALQKAAAR